MLADIAIPSWIAWLLLSATVMGAVTTIWSKIGRPIGRGAKTLRVVNEIASQFRTDSGSSLRDVVNKIHLAAEDSKIAADSLKIGVEGARLLAEQDRAQLEKLLLRLDRLATKVDAGAIILDKAEVDRALVAENLAASQKRADAVVDDEPGAAADAASQTADPNQTRQVDLQ